MQDFLKSADLERIRNQLPYIKIDSETGGGKGIVVDMNTTQSWLLGRIEAVWLLTSGHTIFASHVDFNVASFPLSFLSE